MRPVRILLGLLVPFGLLVGASTARAADVSLFNGLPHRIEVVRLLEGGGEHHPWSGPMEPGSRWRLSLPPGAVVEFRSDAGAIARLQVGPEPKQGHVIRLPGLKGPEPPPPPRGQPSEFPNWRTSRCVKPLASRAFADAAGRQGEPDRRPPVCDRESVIDR